MNAYLRNLYQLRNEVFEDHGAVLRGTLPVFVHGPYCPDEDWCAVDQLVDTHTDTISIVQVVSNEIRLADQIKKQQP